MAYKPKKSKRFDYNLQAVLKYREIKEKQEQEKFSKAEQKFKEEKKKEEEIKEFQKEKYHELREELSDGEIDFHQVQVRKGHLEVLKEDVIEQERLRNEAEQKKDDQREVLVQSVKEKKVLEKDKEKKKDKWRVFMNKEEGKFLDDVGGIGNERKRRANQTD